MARTMTLAILADDLTGACDTGALFTRRAPVPVTVFPQRRAEGDVVVVDAESRALPAADARRRVRAAVNEGMTPERWFKKVDSTLRGAIVVCDAETDADLDLIVAAGLTLSPAPALVGSAGLASALARRLRLAGPPPPLPAGLRWLIVAGSLHPATTAQVAAARGRRV